MYTNGAQCAVKAQTDLRRQIYYQRPSQDGLPLEIVAKILAYLMTDASWAAFPPIDRIALPLPKVVSPLGKLIFLFKNHIKTVPDTSRTGIHRGWRQSVVRKTYSCGSKMLVKFGGPEYSIEINCSMPELICRILNHEPRFWCVRRSLCFRVLKDNRIVRGYPPLTLVRRYN